MAEKAKVYFADFRAPSWRENLPQKLARLMMTAGFGDIDMEGKYVAIKMHFGEPEIWPICGPTGPRSWWSW